MKRTLITTVAVLMLASIAMAQNNSGLVPADLASPGGNAIVGSDGTIYLTKTAFDSSTHSPATTVTAISPTGTTAWTATLANSRGNLVLSGPNLISVTATRSDRTVTTTLTAISTASGATAWTRTINGEVQRLLPFNNGTYAIVVVPATTSGGTATRSLVAIGNDGSVLWTVTI